MKLTNAATYCYRHNPTIMSSCDIKNNVTITQLQNDLSSFTDEIQSQISNIWSFYQQSDKNRRLIILKGILSLSCTSQLSYIAHTVEPMVCADFTAIFPAEITKHIFSLLDASTLCSAAQVSKRWFQLAEDDALWHHMCEQHINKKCTKCGWALPLLLQKRKRILSAAPSGQPQDIQPQQSTFTNKRRRCDDSDSDAQLNPTTINSPSVKDINHAIVTPTDLPVTPPPSKRLRLWKQIYQERLIVERNWRRKEMKLITRNLSVKSSHNTPFHTTTNNNNNTYTSVTKSTINAFQFCEAQNILITTGIGNEDNVIYVWNLETNQLVRTLKGHTRTIRTLQFDDTKLVTGSMDNTIRIWNYHQRPEEDTIKDPCIRILHGSARMVEEEHGNEQQQQQHQFTQGTVQDTGISHLHFQGHLLAAAGCHDKTIQVWNFETGECFRLSGHTSGVNHVRLLQRSDESCSRNNNNNGSKKYQLLSASQDSTIRLWDLEKDNRQCVHVFKGHVGPVEMVIPSAPGSTVPPSLLNKRNPISTANILNSQQQAMSDTVLFSSSLDNTIKIWSLLTGECLQTLFGHVHQGIQTLAFDKLLRRLVSGSKDGSLKLWDIETGLPMYSLIEIDGKRHGESINAAAITGVQISDTRIVSADDGGQLRIWDFSAAIPTPSNSPATVI
ncbi:WD40-repeat-containing domain protein [Mycotypha africana]|uniref:WD40-repeat-containing domain protein n=1 Tax=Mycotypha africana TaxID=64632 RepID=UPI002301CB8D|nr:WD40-repeat-containing domain protein [Mycotypha africana]KAI8967403.1 WD40-repeat-containing domain protein [Mycotypha africana]